MLDGALVPAFAPGCRAHVISGERVLVLSGHDRQVLLSGRPYALVAPWIDGRTPDTAIVAALAGELPAAVVQLALMRMQAQGVVVLDAVGLVLRPSPSADVGTLALAGGGELHWIGVDVDVASALVTRIESSAPAGSGLTVLLVDDYLREELDELAARCITADVALLPIRAAGAEWWIGPFLDGAAAAPLWRLLRARLRANRAGDVEALRLGATFPLRGEPRAADAVIERAVAHAADVIERTLRGGPPASIRDGVLVIDHGGGAEATQHPIAVVAEHEGQVLPAFGEPLPPLRLAADRRARVADSGRRVTAPADTLARMTPLLSPITGIVAGLERVPAVPGTHVYATIGTLEWPAEGADRRPVLRKGALGKGLTDAQARASCIGETIELVSARFTGDEPRLRARWSEVAEFAIHPRELLLVSEGQYAAPTPTIAWDGVPAPFDERQAIEWVPLVSLVDGATRWLPAAYCYFDYEDPLHPAASFAIANANGCAAGGTIEEAILQGLLELVERDACALWWYSGAPRPAIDLDSVGDPRLLAIRDAHTAAGRTLTLLDLTADTGIAVVAAVATGRAEGAVLAGGQGDDAVLASEQTGGTGIASGQADGAVLASGQAGDAVLATGRGCHLDPTIAISRAITELSQGLAIASPGDDALPDLAHLRPSAAPPVRLSDLPDRRREDAAEEVGWCVGMLARLGHDVLVLDTTRADLGFRAVRVVVPGLRPLLPRLAPGRLYDVPPRLGWIPRRLREHELTPHAFVS